MSPLRVALLWSTRLILYRRVGKLASPLPAGGASMPDRGQRDGALFALASDLPGERPAEVEHMADQSNVRSHNLPAQLTPLIGREHEIQVVCAILRRPEVRLVTFTGTGGVGKTRLGLEVATDLLDDFGDGVYFVPLAPISDPDLVVPTIAQALGIKEAGERPLADLLQAHLRDKRLLLTVGT